MSGQWTDEEQESENEGKKDSGYPGHFRLLGDIAFDLVWKAYHRIEAEQIARFELEEEERGER